MSSYLTLWDQARVEIVRREAAAGGDARLDHAASGRFRWAGVTPGDSVYVVAVENGRLLLIGRLYVEEVVDQDEAEAITGEEVYEAPDHLLGVGTTISADRVVPETTARALRRESGGTIGIDPDRYVVNVQSVRTPSRITAASADLLDALLGTIVVGGEETTSEGGRRERTGSRIERSAAVRRRALRIHGTNCMACGFSFAHCTGPLATALRRSITCIPSAPSKVPSTLTPPPTSQCCARTATAWSTAQTRR